MFVIFKRYALHYNGSPEKADKKRRNWWYGRRKNERTMPWYL